MPQLTSRLARRPTEEMPSRNIAFRVAALISQRSRSQPCHRPSQMRSEREAGSRAAPKVATRYFAHAPAARRDGVALDAASDAPRTVVA